MAFSFQAPHDLVYGFAKERTPNNIDPDELKFWGSGLGNGRFSGWMTPDSS